MDSEEHSNIGTKAYIGRSESIEDYYALKYGSPISSKHEIQVVKPRKINSDLPLEITAMIFLDYVNYDQFDPEKAAIFRLLIGDVSYLELVDTKEEHVDHGNESDVSGIKVTETYAFIKNYDDVDSEENIGFVELTSIIDNESNGMYDGISPEDEEELESEFVGD